MRPLMVIAEASVIAVASGAAGIGVNALRSDGVRLAGGTAVPDTAQAGTCHAGPAQFPEIAIEEAAKLLGRTNVTFVDARSASDFALGHLRGAVSLPYDVALASAGKTTLPVPPDNLIIVYCTYVDCSLSSELALILSRNGCRNVRVLRNGYPAWERAGLPTERGP